MQARKKKRGLFGWIIFVGGLMVAILVWLAFGAAVGFLLGSWINVNPLLMAILGLFAATALSYRVFRPFVPSHDD